MPFMGVVHENDKIQVTFHADPENVGNTALMTGFVPDGVHPVPPSEFDMVAPGAPVNQFTRVRPALSMKITVDTPPGGAGLLEVFVNGELRDREQVSDVIWTYGIA